MTAPSSPAKTGEVLRALRERFRASSAGTIETFRALARQLAAAPAAPAVVESLRGEVHRVRGTAGSYGFVDASRLAARLEERVDEWAADPALDRDGRSTIVEHFVSALMLAFEAADASESVSPRRRLLLLDAADDHAPALRAEAPLHGFELRVLAPDAATPTAVREIAPHLVVAPGSAIERAREAALAVSASLVVLADDVDAARRRLEAGPVAAAGALPAAAEPTAIFDLASRLALRGSYRGGTVLIVDDDPLILALARYVIESPDTRVVTVAGASDLVARVEAVAPALLLMDTRLARTSGLEATRALRARPGLRDMPIILFSGDASEETRRAVYEAGADEFIAKPIVPVELRRRIADRLERHRLRRLAAGLDPRSGLPLAERTRRELTDFVAFLRRERLAGTVAVLRTDTPPVGGAEDAWLDEAVRLARALVGAGAIVGLDDDGALLVALGCESGTAEARLRRLADERPADAPTWRAGIVDLAGRSASDVAALRRAAVAALGDARTRGVAIWRWLDAAAAG
jgi:CheY-like chemotaxis protein